MPERHVKYRSTLALYERSNATGQCYKQACHVVRGRRTCGLVAAVAEMAQPRELANQWR